MLLSPSWKPIGPKATHKQRCKALAPTATLALLTHSPIHERVSTPSRCRSVLA